MQNISRDCHRRVLPGKRHSGRTLYAKAQSEPYAREEQRAYLPLRGVHRCLLQQGMTAFGAGISCTSGILQEEAHESLGRVHVRRAWRDSALDGLEFGEQIETRSSLQDARSGEPDASLLAVPSGDKVTAR